MSDWLYSDIVKEHFQNPRNALTGKESDWAFDGRGVVGNMKCGDQMLILLRIDKKTEQILDIRWKTYGCASAIASISVLSEVVKGMSIFDAYKITPQDIVQKLGGLPDQKIHCSVLGDKALRAAIDDYLQKNGKEPLSKTAKSEIVCTCLGITEDDIEKAFHAGAKTWDALQAMTKIGSSCGNCKEKVLEKLEEFNHIFG